MSAILFLIPISVAIAAAFLAAFIWAVRSGQFEDTCTPSLRVLIEDRAESSNTFKRKSDESRNIQIR
jgi:cbb3-type cytochrome oxidase maturation protein